MSAKYLLVACLLLAVIPQQVLCQDVSVEDIMLYNKWRFANKRQYMNENEQVYRQTIFFENVKKIQNHKNNQDATYEIGLNQFSDMTDEEFASRVLNNHLSKQLPEVNKRTNGEEFTPRGADTVPVSFDWRTKGAVHPIKDQGQCGSCWTFSAAGVLESVNKLTNGTLTALSEQQLLDCANSKFGYNSYGCDGGFPHEAFKYTMKYGIVPASQYKYVGFQGTCKITTATTGFKPKNYYQIRNNAEGLKKAITTAPVAVAVDASRWNSYRSGVYNGCGVTRENQLNHAVIAIGYDAQGNWLIKNSFGTSWGESGYMRLAAGNTCGVLYYNYAITM